jgi:cytochrome b561
MKSTENHEYPTGLRIWHWLNFIAIAAILMTVLLRKTFLSYRANSALIQEKAAAAGTPLTKAVADEIAKTMRDRMWDFHVYFGFALAALLVYRLALRLRGSASRSEARFSPNEMRMQRMGYVVFYAFAGFLSVTGLALAFKASLPLSTEIVSFVKEAHELALWGILLFVPLHLAGVLAAEFKSRSAGLISRIIGGGRLGDGR